MDVKSPLKQYSSQFTEDYEEDIELMDKFDDQDNQTPL